MTSASLHNRKRSSPTFLKNVSDILVINRFVNTYPISYGYHFDYIGVRDRFFKVGELFVHFQVPSIKVIILITPLVGIK